MRTVTVSDKPVGINLSMIDSNADAWVLPPSSMSVNVILFTCRNSGRLSSLIKASH